jgi:hypothetical protein
MYLSKSDFKVARNCPTKLYYRKHSYPSNKDENPYLEFLADGGYMIETIAKLLFREGREIDFDSSENAFTKTMAALNGGDATLFEATLIFQNLLARVDILEKTGNRIRLIEIKAKGFNSEEEGVNPFRGARGGILAEWREYLEDVAFQTHILQNLFPEASIESCLCLVDKAVICDADAVFDKFLLTPPDKSKSSKTFNRPQITFIGDVEALRRHSFLKIVDVSDEVAELSADIRLAIEQFSHSVSGREPTRIPAQLGVRCKKCEYHKGSEKNGFRECWGHLSDPVPHLLDLYRVDALGKNGGTATRMIEEGRCALLDVSKSDLRGRLKNRQAIQLEWSAKKREFIDSRLQSRLGKCVYPLNFVDFETSRLAVPYHAGMRPYEQVCFQWSCHTIPAPGLDLEHKAWINLVDAYPNFEFAESLMDAVKGGGTFFVWSPFERTALREIHEQMNKYHPKDRRLAKWLNGMVDDAGPIVDLCELAKEFYFHPLMNGSLSIKDVLPAVWFESELVRNHPWFQDYLRYGENARLLEPYQTLEALPFGENNGDEAAEVVREGTAAMRTYQEMLYGLRKADVAYCNAKKNLLLNYCKLDTAAMVMIWMHWMRGARVADL